jgi:hypothetical protein
MTVSWHFSPSRMTSAATVVLAGCSDAGVTRRQTSRIAFIQVLPEDPAWQPIP